MKGAAIPLDVSSDASWPAITHEYVGQWIRACDAFLKWQREEIIEKEPTTETLSEHRSALKWMLRHTRILHAEIADPDFPVRHFAKAIAGKLLQLEESWQLVHEAIPDAEADALLQAAFPNERRTGGAA